MGTGRALDTGGLANILARLARFLVGIGLKLTEAQIRLILVRLEQLELTDPFTLSREAQEGHLVSLLSEFIGCRPEATQSYLRSC